MAALAAGLGVAGCGGGESGTTKGGYATGAPVAGKRGGTLTVLSRGDVDSLDPGAAYYQLSYLVAYATQRPLFSYRPEYVQAVPFDIAHHPNHLSRFFRRERHLQTLAKRILARPETFGHRFADQNHCRAVGNIGTTERTPAQKRNSHGFKEARFHCPDRHFRLF